MESILDQPQSSNNRRSIDDVLENGYSLSIGDVWSRGSDIWKKNIGGFLLYLILGYAIIMLAGLIPFAGSMATSFILSPAFSAGFFIVAYAISINGSATANDYTKGFKKMGDNALYVLFSAILLILIFIPVIISLISSLAFLLKADYKSAEGVRELMSILAPVMGIAAICFAVAMLAYVLLILAYPLIHIYGLSAIDAIRVSARIVIKQYFTFVILMLTILLLNIGGVLCLLIGLLFTVPLSYCILYAAYELIFEGKKPIE
ncbi:MAG: hypothetical protein RL065_1543 [Bacteroidota bacterium]|jgi:hypothetical protein